jgi:class 3 adenylate cyclase
MHFVKGLFIWLGYQALSHIISDQPSTINPSLPFIDELSINFIQTYLIVNLLILILNLISSIITLFALNSKLFNIAQNLKKVCSWSLDEDILANQVLNGKAELTRQERTILFGDIRGFTKFSNTYTHKIIAFVLQDFYEIVEEVTERYSAYKPEFIADEFLTFFASPDIAVDCALELREKINEQLSPYQLSVGMGIHEGPILEGIIGGKTSKKYSIIGNAANIASRLQTQAKGNQILCSKRIKNKVKDLETGSLMKACLKGIDREFEIYSINGKNGDLKKAHKSKSRFKPFVFFGKIHKNWKRFLNKYFDF